MVFQDKIAGDLIIALNTVLALTSIVSVGIRFRTPNSSQKKVDLQNVMLVLAAFCGTVMSIAQCVGTKFGLGTHMTTLSGASVESLLKVCSSDPV